MGQEGQYEKLVNLKNNWQTLPFNWGDCDDRNLFAQQHLKPFCLKQICTSYKVLLIHGVGNPIPRRAAHYLRP